jgi:quercetin dioxygenase-like cupin family protein
VPQPLDLRKRSTAANDEHLLLVDSLKGATIVIRRWVALVSFLALIATATAFSLAQSTSDALDPVRVAPDTHKVAFENALVRVLEVHIPPGSIEPRHRHPHGLSVYLSDWQAKVTVDGNEALVNQRKTGSFAWSEAVIHTVQNIGPTEGHVLRIELKY